MNVFIVDDSAIVRKKLAAMLSEIAGVHCIGEARNAIDAIRSIPELKPDAVILDIRLGGGGNGIDVLKQVKKHPPSPIVIMLTNYPYPQYRERCLALGADYFFDKVTEIEQVYEVLNRLTRAKPFHRMTMCNKSTA
jgi:DNA-binding NarL/FixJ family response regulator